jgi:hypothetical protein
MKALTRAAALAGAPGAELVAVHVPQLVPHIPSRAVGLHHADRDGEGYVVVDVGATV